MILERINALQRLWTSHVLLYHSTFPVAPGNIQERLHNVAPDQLYVQIRWLKQHFDFVSVDDAVIHPRIGTVAVTFDDAYECVFRKALPVLESLSVPCTVFLNGCSLMGQTFWRDKVRFLINASLVDDFIAFYAARSDDGRDLNSANFYKLTKSPRVNSRTVSVMIDRFLEETGRSFANVSYCVRDASHIPRSPWLTLGNHSLHHYVLSSLGDEEQQREIRANHNILAGLGLPVSTVFSVPFGRPSDFNECTLRILRDLGYSGFLYSRELLNLRGMSSGRRGDPSLPSAERYMVPSMYDAFQTRIFKLGLKSIREALRPERR